MARKIADLTTLDDCEDEVLFTRAALKADPDAADLVAITDGWLGLIDEARAADRAARSAITEATALRGIANARLDDACRAFGDDLHIAVKRDRTSARWKRFFPHTVSDFVRQRLSSQISAVQGWLAVTGDDVLDKHRPELERWSKAAADALTNSSASRQARGGAQVSRESLAEDLTRERDRLEGRLTAKAHELNLPRDYSSRFFRIFSRSTGGADGESAAPHAPGTSPASTVAQA